VLTFLLLACAANPDPPFVVSNKVPPAFTVVNKAKALCPCGDACKCDPAKCPGSCPAAKAKTYADVYARVLKGEEVTFTAPLPGFPGAPGQYRCFLRGGVPVMEPCGPEG
jgi:hypothetical protein